MMFTRGPEKPFWGGASDRPKWASVKSSFNLKSIIFGPGPEKPFWGGAHDDPKWASVKSSFNLKSIIFWTRSMRSHFDEVLRMTQSGSLLKAAFI